jgi:hypothetical protein
MLVSIKLGCRREVAESNKVRSIRGRCLAVPFGKIPGPMGSQSYEAEMDAGTLARIASPPPGPVGFHQRIKASSPQSATTLLGLTIHPESKISADDWVNKINVNQDTPDYFVGRIKANGSVIFVTDPNHFEIPKGNKPYAWVGDWIEVFKVDEWEMTTGSLEVKVKKGGPQEALIQFEVKPDLSSGETIGNSTKDRVLTQTAHSVNDPGLTLDFGYTLPQAGNLAGIALNSGRTKSIVVTNRATLNLGGTIQKINVSDPDLVDTWFHEIGCHAGRKQKKLRDWEHTPDDKTTPVEVCASDIDEIFKNREAGPKIWATINAYLK